MQLFSCIYEFYIFIFLRSSECLAGLVAWRRERFWPPMPVQSAEGLHEFQWKLHKVCRINTFAGLFTSHCACANLHGMEKNQNNVMPSRMLESVCLQSYLNRISFWLPDFRRQNESIDHPPGDQHVPAAVRSEHKSQGLVPRSHAER